MDAPVLTASDQPTVAQLNARNTTVGAPVTATGAYTPSPDQALLVTSGASRAVTADNTSKLQNITAGLTAKQTATTSAQSGNSTTVQTPSNGSSGASTTQPNYSINGQGNIVDKTGALVASKDGNGQYSSVSNASGQVVTGLDAAGNLLFGTSKTPADTSGSSSDTGDTTTDSSTTDASNDAAVAGISDPGLKAQYKTQLDALDQQKAQAQKAIDDAKATLANDPVAQAAIDSIKDKMDQQIQLMKDKNTQVLGRANTSVAAFGGLGIMGQNFLSDEQDRATQRISALVAQEQDLVLKATIAYQAKDLKALNDAMTAYDKVNTDKLKAINTLLTETNKVVAQAQAQQRIDATTAKNAIAADISKSTNLGISLAKAIADSGITDPDQIDAYIQSAAEEYGITNPEILKNAITKAQGTAAKDALATKNTNDTIQNRDVRTGIAAANAGNKTTIAKGGGTDGSYKYTADDITAYKNLLNTGGTSPDGTKFNGRGKDTYVDPGAYIAAYTDWKNNGGTPAGFLKKFPVSSVNPASYGLLPAEIQPKAKATTSTYKTTP